MDLLTLPNTQRVFCVNAAEAKLLYEDIFRDRCYLQSGIAIRDGDCVFDIGANIGLFSLFASQQAEGLRLYAFEPIPRLYEVLSANMHLHKVNAQILQCGLAATRGEATFAFYERNSAMSGRYWDPGEERRLARTILINKFPDIAEIVDELVADSFTPQYFLCPLRTVSDVIDDYQIARIDLLKVDVEKSEMDVLEGIDARHWPLINQVVVEVHNIDDRVIRVQRLLEQHGLNAAVFRGKYFAGTGLCDIHASRLSSRLRTGRSPRLGGNRSTPEDDAT